MKPLLLVDIDQVVCDFVTPFCEWGNKVFGKDISPAGVDCYDMFRLFGIPEGSDGYVVEDFFQSRTEIPEVPGAVAGLKTLAKDFHIWYVTARPRSATQQTVTWLEEKGIRHRVIHCRDKVRTINQFTRPVFGLIEDNPSTALEAAGQGMSVWLLDYPYNREAWCGHDLTHVTSWPALVKSITGTEQFAPGLTMSEKEYADMRFLEAVRTYLEALYGRPIEIGYQQVVQMPDGQLRLEIDLKVVS